VDFVSILPESSYNKYVVVHGLIYLFSKKLLSDATNVFLTCVVCTLLVSEL